MNSREERLIAILDGIGDCFYAVDRAWRITVFNRWAEDFFRITREMMIGRILWDVLDVEVVAGLAEAYRAAMAGQASELTLISSPARPDRWLEGRAFPLPDGMGVAFRDVTDRVRDEQALRRREAELARVQRIAEVGGVDVQLTRGFPNRRSPEYLRLHGLKPESATESYEEWLRRVHPEDRERADRTFRDAICSEVAGYEAEYRIIRPSDGELRWIQSTAEIERDENGRAKRLIGAHRDVTERKRSDERQRLLINELNHRVKNTLATVQSIASQSIRGASERAEIWPSLEGRLLALSRAHDVLTREEWSDVDLQQVVETAVAPYRESASERFRVAGPPVRLPPRLAIAVAMVVQELVTNAVKYGALLVAVGTVDIAWTLDDGPPHRLALRWAEADGPPVAAPRRRGFGSRLIESSLASEVDGAVDLRFPPAGVRCEMRVTLPAYGSAVVPPPLSATG